MCEVLFRSGQKKAAIFETSCYIRKVLRGSVGDRKGMSVIKRFLISVAVAMLIVLAGLFMMSVDGARKHLETQLQIQSSNVATTLAIALSQPSNQLPASQERSEEHTSELQSRENL